jgi:hypothetical protein
LLEAPTADDLPKQNRSSRARGGLAQALKSAREGRQFLDSLLWGEAQMLPQQRPVDVRL